MELKTDEMIIIKGENKTNAVASYEFHSDKCNVVFHSSSKIFRYNVANVSVLKVHKLIDPKSVIFKANGCTITNIDKILDFGEYYRIVQSNRRDRFYRRNEVVLSPNCLYDASAEELFSYFKETAKAVSLKTENGINILEKQYERIFAVDESTVLANYLNPHKQIGVRSDALPLIYPFGMNQSQRKAVQNAFRSQISIIQGPPGTGKTQTILNIIANAVSRGKTVAVVSNNNAATQNVAEKLEKQGLSFLTAFLGSYENKERFLESQTGTYPGMATWERSGEEMETLKNALRKLSSELTTMLDAQNRIAQIERELLELKPEQFYFSEYYKSRKSKCVGVEQLRKLSSEKLLLLWIAYENYGGKKVGLFKKILLTIRYNRAAVRLFESSPESAIPFLQNLYYQSKISELNSERNSLELQLKDYCFEDKMEKLRKISMAVFRAELAERFLWRLSRHRFEMEDFRRNPNTLMKEYPVVLSTTYSIKGTLSPDFIYDYLIVDEASQVDLATGVLAFCCAKNIVIVGDLKQLPNVLTPNDVRIADIVWNSHKLDERYHFTVHSLLSSASEIWPKAPSVLLKEHYRCHPKIAGFFNQEFYNGELIVMTRDHGESDVLTMFRTSPGNHARGHFNQRQIDVIREEILPKLKKQGFTSIGIITPYRSQVAALKQQLGPQVDVATVHKFQGREKEAIILTSVDNRISDFVDDPNMLNVAVSRAIKSLSVVISSNCENEKTNYGDLAKYIEYNNCQIIDSKIFSVFDLLYREYYVQRTQYLKKHKRISEFDSENLAYSIITKVLKQREFSKIGCAVHTSLATVVKDHSILTEQEVNFSANPLTHIDFLMFNKINKVPILAIEIDGTKYHAAGSRQEERDIMKNRILQKCGIAVLRIRTNESGEEQRIYSALQQAIS